MILQGLTLPDANLNLSPSVSSATITNLLVLGLVIAAAAIAVVVLRNSARQKNKIPRALEYVVLLVLLPKESMREDEQKRDWREILAGFETLFVTLAGVRPQTGNALSNGLRNWWYGRHDHLALEIVAHRGYIHFYLAVPRAVRQLVELQIQAQYPQAHIEEAEDYNLFGPKSVINGTMLHLTKPYFFPIRTYKRLDSDPLNAITNVLSKVQAQEGAAVQILLRPKPKGWQSRGRNIARRMQEGDKLEKAMGGGAASGVGLLGASLKSSQSEYLQQRTVPYITPMDQELIKSLEEKSGKPGFEVNIRIVTASPLAR